MLVFLEDSQKQITQVGTNTGFTAINNLATTPTYFRLNAYRYDQSRFDSNKSIFFSTDWNGVDASVGSITMRVGTDQNVSIGPVGTSGSRLTVMGSGNTSATVNFKTLSLDGTSLCTFYDDGQTFISQNGAATYFGNYVDNNNGNWAKQSAQEFQQFSSTALYAGFHARRGSNGASYLKVNNSGNSFVGSTGTMSIGTNWNGNFPSSIGTTAIYIDTSQRVAIGANSLSVNSSALEVTGDTEILGVGNGYIVLSPDGTRWRITVDNTGAITTATV